MDDRTNPNAPPLMRPYVPPPSRTAALRAEMVATRQRLSGSVARVQEMMAPSHLIATGVRTLGHAAGGQLAGAARSALQRSVTSSILGPKAALLGAIATTLLARRNRARRDTRTPE